MTEATELVLIANARMPSQRAQSLQVAQVASAFARAGARTTLLHARRHPTPPLPPGCRDVLDYYAVPAGPRPTVRAVSCVDWIDRVPRRAQYLPARVQELTFARNAARHVRRDHPAAWILSREVEAARPLLAGPEAARVFLEVHRVPGGATRLRWLREAGAAAAGIVAISGGVRDDLVDLGLDAGRIRVEHDGVDAARFADLPTREAARAELGLGPEPLVVYTGGLLAWKGVDVLIEAARALPGVRFVVAGGMDADVARERARAAGLANLRLDGFQPPARVGLYLAAGDVGVVPNRSTPAISARYTSPLKVFEAFAAGLPLVASDLPSLRDAAGEDALFVQPDDPAALAGGITTLLGDADLRGRLAAAGRARAAEATWDARARRLLAWMGERVGAAA